MYYQKHPTNLFQLTGRFFFLLKILNLYQNKKIGRDAIAKVLAEAGVDENKKVEAWSDDEVGAIRTAIATGFKVEGELRSEVSQDIKRLMDIGCQRGIRHRNGLPLRGQRTKNNSRTRKGKRKTVANKKK